MGDNDELADLTAAIGYTPIEEIMLYAMCNQSGDHRLLAQLAVTALTVVDGWVDFHGAITPPFAQQQAQYPRWDGTWPVTIEPAEAEIWRYVNGFPGRVCQIRYELGGGNRWVYHVADATFLRAWLASPDFI